MKQWPSVLNPHEVQDDQIRPYLSCFSQPVDPVVRRYNLKSALLQTHPQPNRYRTAWFQATQTGSFHLFCAEYCGTQHSGMIGQVVVMEPADYERWLAQNGEGSLASSGEKLFRHYGCISCHRADSGQRGPDLAGLYGKQVFLSDGRSLVVDKNYIRESILEPKAKIVAGFQPIMPTFQGQVNEEEMLQLVSYIRSLQQMPLNVNPDADIPSPEMRRRNPEVQPVPGEPMKVPNR